MRSLLLHLVLCLLCFERVHGQFYQSNLDVQQAPQMPSNCRRSWEWQCKSGECIAQYDVCDGIRQCADGSDEWICDDLAKMRRPKPMDWLGQQQPQQQQQQPQPAASTASAAPGNATTTAAPASSAPFLSLTKPQFFVMVVSFVTLCVCVIAFIRRRARLKSLSRNRRGNITQAMFTQDSEDEDDVLISSMYS